MRSARIDGATQLLGRGPIGGGYLVLTESGSAGLPSTFEEEMSLRLDSYEACLSARHLQAPRILKALLSGAPVSFVEMS